MASSNYLINFYENTNTLWKSLGEKTLSIYNNKYRPYLNITSGNYKLLNIPISIDLNYEYNPDEYNDLTFNYKNKLYGIRFDKHSESSYSNFKKTFNTIKDKKFFTKYYDNGRIKITGGYSNDEYNGYVTEYYNNDESSIKFEGEMEDNEYVEGIFKNQNGTIKLEALNIVCGLINGYIKIIYNNSVDTVEDQYLFTDINGYGNLNISSSSFVEDVCGQVYGNEFMKELRFHNLSNNDKLYKLYCSLEEISIKLEQINQKNNGIFGTVTNIYNYIFSRR
tara:strand:- start:131 stop:967 length:837 start_codon:yes stop_codon:yes gene_type:complete